MLQVTTFSELLHQARVRYADRPFLEEDELLGRVSYDDLHGFAQGLEKQFEEAGIPVGAPVATIFHNCGLAALMFLAVIASRRLFVPLNPASTKSELDYMLDRARCAAVILDPSHARSDDFGNRLVIPVTDHRDYFQQLCATARPAELRTGHENSATDKFVGEVVYTSGSTGRPKGVVLSESSLLANAQSLAGAYELTGTDRFLSVCPLFHNSGQVFTTLACALVGGSTAAVKSDVGMLHFWHYVDQYRAHWSLGMVSFLALLLSRREGPGSQGAMRGLLTGGSAIDAGLVQRFESRFGIPVRTVYGLTESSSIATCEPINPGIRSLGSSGRPLPSSPVRIGPSVNELASAESPAARQPGEIWISGPTVFDRYLEDPELTRFRKQDGWLRTGDLGYFDENGNLFVVDRLDSMLIVGGENVYPAEIEKFCTALPGAAQVVLAGIDHPIWGKELILVYKLAEDADAAISGWHRTLAENVAAFKLPQRYVSISEFGLAEFPRKENGKLDRPAITRLLTERFTSRSREAVR